MPQAASESAGRPEESAELVAHDLIEEMYKRLAQRQREQGPNQSERVNQAQSGGKAAKPESLKIPSQRRSRNRHLAVAIERTG